MLVHNTLNENEQVIYRVALRSDSGQGPSGLVNAEVRLDFYRASQVFSIGTAEQSLLIQLNTVR